MKTNDAAAEFERARLAVNSHRGSDDPSADDQVFEALIAAQDNAMEMLLATPAETIADVRLKIDFFAEAEGFHITDETKALFKALRADLNRLAGL
jgi:hypothetical protein